MSIEKFSNCFVSEEEAEAFFENHMSRDAWFEADEGIRERILLTATNIFDGFAWAGHVREEDQPLSFPRDGLYYDKSRGKLVAFKEDALPRAIFVGFLEFCLHLLKNPAVLDAAPTVRSFKLGPIYMDNIKGVQAFPDSVYMGIKTFLVNGGSNRWWRAN